MKTDDQGEWNRVFRMIRMRMGAQPSLHPHHPVHPAVLFIAPEGCRLQAASGSKKRKGRRRKGKIRESVSGFYHFSDSVASLQGTLATAGLAPNGMRIML